ncbi:class F sortase [Streptacidiphilus monticola]|uniref:Class F sortase n=1 Tax=Streptacidiphilus monticola TaxID=2161674 RepID=A0ABW1FZW3_9ACTN
MSTVPPRLRRRAAAVLAAAGVVAGAWLLEDGATARGPAAPPVAAGDPAADLGVSADARTPLARSVPVRLTVPTLRLNAPLVPVGLDAQRHVEPPPLNRPKVAGWYAGGATPGSAGTAVIVGHVDDDHGAAVFFLLGRLRPGDPVRVRLRNGATATFRVDAVRLYPKDRFPDRLVYAGRRGTAQLRLITCGGRWDRRDGYSANTVVFAHLAR